MSFYYKSLLSAISARKKNPFLRPLLWQSAAVGAACAAGAALDGLGVALAVLYGGAVAISNLALLAWQWQAGAKKHHRDAQKHLLQFYRFSLERFIVVGILLVVWFAFVKFKPLAMLTGFLIGQLAGIFAVLAAYERI